MNQSKSAPPRKVKNETKGLEANPKLVKKVRIARKEIKEGKGVKIDITNLWK